MKVNTYDIRLGEVSSITASQAGKLASGPSESRASALPMRLRQRPPLTTTQYVTTSACEPLRKGTSIPSSLTRPRPFRPLSCLTALCLLPHPQQSSRSSTPSRQPLPRIFVGYWATRGEVHRAHGVHSAKGKANGDGGVD